MPASARPTSALPTARARQWAPRHRAASPTSCARRPTWPRSRPMLNFLKQCLAAFCIGAILLLLTTVAEAQSLNAAGDDGLVRVRSAYPIDETVARMRQDIAAKGITFFQEVDQAKLAAGAGI